MVYDYLLRRGVESGDLPEHVALVVTGGDLLEDGGEGLERLDDFFEWCDDLGIERVSVYVSLISSNQSVEEHLVNEIENLETPVCLRSGNDGSGHARSDAPYEVSVGLDGRNEFVNALREIAREVENDDFDPSELDSEKIEENLVFEGEPDVIIKTGGEHLSDFMIWQSVYSELYFADYNWQNFRKRDLLRSIRDFQDRERRFGR